MGHKLTENGISPDEKKISAIKTMSIPKDKSEVQRFLGMVNYIGRFIPNLANLNSPLRTLLKKDVPFMWDENHTCSFNELKKILTSEPVLQFFDVNKHTVISVDSSKDGLGAVLLQNNLPCAYASKALSNSQINWAQIEKELAAVLFGCEKFSQYVYGSKFTVETDHKPLIFILKKPLASCPPRLQKMLLALQKFNFNLVYKPGKDLFIADTLSRTAEKNSSSNDFHFDMDSQICVVDLSIDFTEEKLKEYQEATSCDVTLKRLLDYLKNGWPKSIKKVPSDVRHYFKFRYEIVQFNGLLYKGNKLIVPRDKRKEIISKIHYSHLGIVKCKNRAAESFYWPGMSTHIEDVVSNCKICLTFQNNNRIEPLMNHEIPDKPWTKIGCDILYMGRKMYLLAVDYYSKWIELVPLSSNAHSQTVIDILKDMFSKLGIPKTLVSDGGPQFNSIYFQKFASEWSFKHIFTSPRNPQSNGQVERAKQTIKKLLSKAVLDNKDVNLVLLSYRNTPLDHLGFSPSELLMSRKLRDILPAANEKLKSHLIDHNKYLKNLKLKQNKQKQYFDNGKKSLSSIKSDQQVRYQKHKSSNWSFGTVIDKIRPRTYRVKTENGNILTRNRRYIEPISNNLNNDLISHSISSPENKVNPETIVISSDSDSDYYYSSDNEDSTKVNFNNSTDQNLSNVPSMSSKGRVIKKPERLNYF